MLSFAFTYLKLKPLPLRRDLNKEALLSLHISYCTVRTGIANRIEETKGGLQSIFDNPFFDNPTEFSSIRFTSEVKVIGYFCYSNKSILMDTFKYITRRI